MKFYIGKQANNEIVICKLVIYTIVEPLNKGFGDTASVLISEVVLFLEVKNVLMLW